MTEKREPVTPPNTERSLDRADHPPCLGAGLPTSEAQSKPHGPHFRSGVLNMSEPKESPNCAGWPEVTKICFCSPLKKGPGLSGFHVADGKRDFKGLRKVAEATPGVCSSRLCPLLRFKAA